MATPKRNPIEDLRSMSIMNGFGMGLPEMDYGGMGANVGPMPMSNTGSQYEDEEYIPQTQRPRQTPPASTTPIRPPAVPSSPVPGGMQSPDMAALMKQWYTPETQATDRFNRYLDTAPELNRPGIGRRIVASAAALGKGGIENADKILYSPYAHQMADWKAKGEPYYQAANLERQSNINERQLAGQMATQTINQQKVDISRDRAEVYRFKAEHPNLKGDVTGPTLKVFDPSTGQWTDTGYPTGQMSEFDKVNLQGEWNVKAAQERGLDTQALETLRQMGREKVGGQIYQDENKVIWERRPDGTWIKNPQGAGGPAGVIAKPGTAPTNRPASANEVRGDRNNLMQEIYDQYPQYRKWMKPPDSPNGRWELLEPPKKSIIFGTNAGDKAKMDEYNELKKLLYPSGTETKPSSSFSSVIGGSSSVGGRGAGPPPTSTGGRGSMPPSTPSNTGRGAGPGPIPPPTSPGVQPVIQHSPSTGRYRISYDGGKTWRDYNPNGKK